MEIVSVEGFPGYKVSDTGVVFSCRRGKQEFEMKNGDKDGYKRVALYQEGKRHNRSVHRLVAEHFVSNEEGFPEVNHIDGDKSNNNSENLEWCTHDQNIKHAWDSGLIDREHLSEVMSKKMKGRKVCRKAVENQANTISGTGHWTWVAHTYG